MRCCDVQLKSINRSEPLSIRVQAAKPRATKPIKTLGMTEPLVQLKVNNLPKREYKYLLGSIL